MTPMLRVILICAALAFALSGGVRADPYDEIFKHVEDEDEYLSLLDQLDTIARDPVNLLEADFEELNRLPWVSPWLAREIVALRRSGGLRGVGDLRSIKGVDSRLVELLRPFVVVVPPAKPRLPLEVSLRTRVIASPAASSFEAVKTYARAYARYSSYEAGLLAEKDRDENQLNDLQTAFGRFDFPGGKLILGDYLLVSGHGLVFSNPYGYSPSTVEPWRFSQGDFGVKPYTSVDENFALRGLAFEYGNGRTGICVAISRSRFDARLDEDGKVTSLPMTGLHLPGTTGEDALREDLVGLAIRTGRGKAGIGLDVSASRFDREVGIDRLDHLGKSLSLAGSVDLSFLGEASAAFLQGGLADGDGAVIGGFGYDRQSLEFLVLGRYYSERFFSLHARPFAFYSGLATGERGILTRMAFGLPADVEVSIGNDLHERRAEDNGVARPSGSQSFLDIEIPAGAFTFTVGEKILMSEEPPAHDTDPTRSKTRLRSRLDVRYDAARWLDVRMRYEDLRYSEKRGSERERSSSGLVRLDIAARIVRILTIKAGLHAFTIGSYGSRIYQYEAGIPYYPAIEMLKSDGSRWYSVLSCDMTPFGRLAAKYAMTIYDTEADRSQFLCYYSLRF